MLAKIIDNHTIEVYDLTQFDTHAIMHSGQVFRYFPVENGFELVSANNFAKILPQNDKVVIKCNDSKYFWNFFDLDTDYNDIKQQLRQFSSLIPAIEAGGGIRILRADFAEVVVSFIISANNNIKRFTKTLNGLAEKFGDKLPSGMHSFPTLKQLSLATQDDFKTLGCGYRAPYLEKAICQLQSLDTNSLKTLPTSQLDKELQQICGVGPKVSACIMLFCGDFHRLDTAPVDTWINKAINQLNSVEKSALFTHKYAGVAQQYIFYYLQHLHQTL